MCDGRVNDVIRVSLLIVIIIVKRITITSVVYTATDHCHYCNRLNTELMVL